ncbi:hypothetical protein [Hyphomonas sp.]|jgi:hypothetical protein|uniref:hypothetical protein n=1 Tax=Hyphomonas sp. TaxID=87 RepID=UPI0026121225|nr:hypothetical protein [Hyphomonas sp.]MDF1807098.1 hypothetical protein [Hyphomonas sp.]
MSANEWPFDVFELGLDAPELWRMAEELTVTQCALLLLGLDPQEHQFVENWEHSKTPLGYIAARDALIGALRRGSLNGNVIEQTHTCLDPDGMNPHQRPTTGSSDPERSTVEVESLIVWLEQRGIRRSFFSPALSSREPYRDQTHPRYSAKLAAVVEAWESYDEASSQPGTPKQRLMKWFRLNAARFGLTGEDGSPMENVIEELAKVANWATSGGAPKQSSEEPIPF